MKRPTSMPGERGARAVQREQSARAKSLATEPSNENAKSIACYTAPLAQMSAAFGRKLPLTTLSMLVMTCCAFAQEPPDQFAQQATQIVAEVMNRAGSPGFVTLDVQSKSSLSA